MTRYRRAFGFDKQVIHLNCKISLRCDWPVAPHIASRVVRSVVHPLKEAVRTIVAGTKSLVRRPSRRRVEEETKKSAVHKALSEYRRKLERVFGGSKRVGEIVWLIGAWSNAR